VHQPFCLLLQGFESLTEIVHVVHVLILRWLG
jgi:hypothetical protein